MKLIRDLDWPIMLQRLDEAGVGMDALSKATGIPGSTLRATKVESVHAARGWDQGLKLLDMYMQHVSGTIPYYGEHNE